MQNLKNDDHFLSITTRSGKATSDPSMPIVDDERDDVVDIDEVAVVESEKVVNYNESS